MRRSERKNPLRQHLREFLSKYGKEGFYALQKVYQEAAEEHRRSIYFKEKGFVGPRHFSLALPSSRRSKNSHHDRIFPVGVDHPEAWIKKGEHPILLSQPYGLGLEEVRDHLRFCEKHGFDLRIGAFESYHLPGETIAVIMRKPLKNRRPEDDAEDLRRNARKMGE